MSSASEPRDWVVLDSEHQSRSGSHPTQGRRSSGDARSGKRGSSGDDAEEQPCSL